MKRWVLVTVALYALLLVLLTVPAFVVGWLKWSDAGQRWEMQVSPDEAFTILQTWQYWVWLVVMVVTQALLLLVPADLTRQRLTPRRRLLVPVVVGSFLLGNLCLAGILSVLAAVMGDGVSKIVEVPAAVTRDAIRTLPGLETFLMDLGLTPGGDLFVMLHLFGPMVFLWMVWGLVFHHVAKADGSETLVRRATKWLLRGSILELLVAVPSHIVLRQRDDCCAPVASFWGIVTGISVMLLSFGPGVLFLFAARLRRGKPRAGSPSD